MSPLLRAAGAALVLLAGWSLWVAAAMPPPPARCSDSIDNDGDGLTDYPTDPDCFGPLNGSEQSAAPYVACPHPTPHSHTYGPPNAGPKSAASTVTAPLAQTVTAWDTNVVDCDLNGIPGDFDGDLETGGYGGFFGFGPWADEVVCDYALQPHGPFVIASDFVFGAAVGFVVAADDTAGPMLVGGGCLTNGVIGVDPDDCISAIFIGAGATCGAGGDGGYWVFLLPFPLPPTLGALTA